MMYLAALSFIASVMYFYVGYNVYHLNKKSELCRIFFLFTISMTIWSFAGGFTYLVEDRFEYFFWNKLSAIGWCTFEAIALHFVMTLTGYRRMQHWYIKLIIYAPAMILLGMFLFLFGPGIETPQLMKAIFNTINFIYNSSYLSATIILIASWGKKSKSSLIKKQAFIITVSSIIPFILNLVVQTIMPMAGLPKLPYIGQIFMLIMLFGVNNSIFRYQFMSIPTSLITNELFFELNGLTFLLDSQGYIIKSNRLVNSLLHYEGNGTTGCHITDIINNPEFDLLMKDCEAIHKPVKVQGLSIPSSTGGMIPFHISVVPLRSKSNLLMGLLIIGEDVSVTEELYKNNESINKLNSELLAMNDILMNKSIKDSLTNLYNHQYINELLEQKLHNITSENYNLCVMMLDFDYFKQVNDRFGHQIGDEILIQISHIITMNVRKEDYVGRYGGEEFLVVLPDITLEIAVRIAERIRINVQNFEFGLKDLRTTISIGVVQYQGETSNALINKADKLLYQAKNNGRNRVEA